MPALLEHDELALEELLVQVLPDFRGVEGATAPGAQQDRHRGLRELLPPVVGHPIVLFVAFRATVTGEGVAGFWT